MLCGSGQAANSEDGDFTFWLGDWGKDLISLELLFLSVCKMAGMGEPPRHCLRPDDSRIVKSAL